MPLYTTIDEKSIKPSYHNQITVMFRCCFPKKVQRLPETLGDIPANLPRYIPKVHEGIVASVYDGDTITIAGYTVGDPQLYKFSVRLLGIDCPEIRGKSTSEKRVAGLAKVEVEQLCLGRHVRLSEHAQEKYGRLLARVSVSGIDISDHLISKKLAVPYDGKTKKTPDDWEEYAGLARVV